MTPPPPKRNLMAESFRHLENVDFLMDISIASCQSFHEASAHAARITHEIDWIFFFFIDKKAVIRNQVKINQNQYRPSLEMLFGDFKTEPSTEPIDCSYQVHWTHWLHRSTGIASFSYAIEMNRFNFNVISKPDPMTLKWLKFFQYWNRFRNPIQSYTSECN